MSAYNRRDVTLSYRFGYYENNQFFPYQEVNYNVDVENRSYTELFDHFTKFLRSIGATEEEIVRGACDITFLGGRDSTITEMVRQIGNFTPNDEVENHIRSQVEVQLSTYMSIDRNNDKNKWENKYWDLQKEYQEKMMEMKAKISRLENPDNKQYTEEELNHMEWHAQQNGGTVYVSEPNLETNADDEHVHHFEVVNENDLEDIQNESDIKEDFKPFELY